MSQSPNIIDLNKERKAAELQAKVQELIPALATSEKGNILGILSNLILIIGNDPHLSGMCAYDEFQHNAVLRYAAPSPFDDAPALPGPFPRQWTAADVSHVQSYIQRVWTRQAKKSEVEDAMFAVASSRRYHPVRDWLDSLKWDNEKRVIEWLSMTFGCERDAYHDEVAVCFLVAAVRRIRQPGVKFDHMPVLEGAQGIGKSTAIKTLFGTDWFTDSLPSSLESKDASLGLQGVWCIEFAEIEQIIRAEVEVIKAFLSRSTDRFRAPYGRNFISYPRQCVMIGTTNDRDYLRDASGNRRFWPVWCNWVNLNWLAVNREQLWAEAADMERRGEGHWLTEANTIIQATNQQAERQQEDVWEEKVKNFLESKKEAKTAEVMSEALFIPIKDQERRQQMRVSAIMKRMGWRQKVTKEMVAGKEKSVRIWTADDAADVVEEPDVSTTSP